MPEKKANYFLLGKIFVIGMLLCVMVSLSAAQQVLEHSVTQLNIATTFPWTDPGDHWGWAIERMYGLDLNDDEMEDRRVLAIGGPDHSYGDVLIVSYSGSWSVLDATDLLPSTIGSSPLMLNQRFGAEIDQISTAGQAGGIDIDGDGSTDTVVAVGSPGYNNSGAVYIYGLNPDGTKMANAKIIRRGSVPGLLLSSGSDFGESIDHKDVNDDGAIDLVVTGPGSNAVWTVFLQSDGSPTSAAYFTSYDMETKCGYSGPGEFSDITVADDLLGANTFALGTPNQVYLIGLNTDGTLRSCSASYIVGSGSPPVEYMGMGLYSGSLGGYHIFAAGGYPNYNMHVTFISEDNNPAGDESFTGLGDANDRTGWEDITFLGYHEVFIFGYTFTYEDELVLALSAVNADSSKGDVRIVNLVMDGDEDGVRDLDDNCPEYYNPTQADSDGDGLGDACDAYPIKFDIHIDLFADTDLDTFYDLGDNCPTIPNPTQQDLNGNGRGDACELSGEEPPSDEIYEIKSTKKISPSTDPVISPLLAPNTMYVGQGVFSADGVDLDADGDTDKLFGFGAFHEQILDPDYSMYCSQCGAIILAKYDTENDEVAAAKKINYRNLTAPANDFWYAIHQYYGWDTEQISTEGQQNGIDFDEDGVADNVFAVTAKGAAAVPGSGGYGTGYNTGALYIHALDENGDLKLNTAGQNYVRVDNPNPPGGEFGTFVTSFDVDKDNVPDLLVGVPKAGETQRGGVYIIFLNENGTQKDWKFISPDDLSAFGITVPGSGFGRGGTYTRVDVDGDGTIDDALLVSASASYYLAFNTDGTLKAAKTAPGLGSFFGVADLGSYSGSDRVIAVGYHISSPPRVRLNKINQNGAVVDYLDLNSSVSGNYYGSSVSELSNLYGTTNDIIVSAYLDDAYAGAVYITDLERPTTGGGGVTIEIPPGEIFIQPDNVRIENMGNVPITIESDGSFTIPANGKGKVDLTRGYQVTTVEIYEGNYLFWAADNSTVVRLAGSWSPEGTAWGDVKGIFNPEYYRVLATDGVQWSSDEAGWTSPVKTTIDSGRYGFGGIPGVNLPGKLEVRWEVDQLESILQVSASPYDYLFSGDLSEVGAETPDGITTIVWEDPGIAEGWIQIGSYYLVLSWGGDNYDTYKVGFEAPGSYEFSPVDSTIQYSTTTVNVLCPSTEPLLYSATDGTLAYATSSVSLAPDTTYTCSAVTPDGIVMEYGCFKNLETTGDLSIQPIYGSQNLFVSGEGTFKISNADSSATLQLLPSTNPLTPKAEADMIDGVASGSAIEVACKEDNDGYIHYGVLARSGSIVKESSTGATDLAVRLVDTASAGPAKMEPFASAQMDLDDVPAFWFENNYYTVFMEKPEQPNAPPAQLNNMVVLTRADKATVYSSTYGLRVLADGTVSTLVMNPDSHTKTLVEDGRQTFTFAQTVTGAGAKFRAMNERQVSGSLLTIFEPVLIDATSGSDSVPFVYDTADNYWEVTVTFTPPEGCTVNTDTYSVNVDKSTEAVLFNVSCGDVSLAPPGGAPPVPEHARGVARAVHSVRDCTKPGCPPKQVVSSLGIELPELPEQARGTRGGLTTNELVIAILAVLVFAAGALMIIRRKRQKS